MKDLCFCGCHNDKEQCDNDNETQQLSNNDN